ncbi:beta-phosphoglucomutase [Lacticaseibacillus hegangensis]|uniref:Beta-phosphoglucomutase n=1 Tax=Lacticaseibacillus hegangensis TaxID=2486010 RepID=A0ABW4CYD4_9LACO|nr:beta-phosphoglucomutase [Lacticaseibacillus hegangensis]
MLKGLLFDLDGVLTDSAKYHLQAWNQLATDLNITLPPEANQQLRGRSRLDSLNLVLSYGHQENRYTSAQKAAFAKTKNQMYLHLIEAMTPADILPGISDLLAAAKAAHLTMVIASASRNAPVILTRLGLAEQFDGIVDPATLHRGKPDPEIYERAQALAKLNTTEVAAFEDAAVGVSAIKAAGQFAVGIGDPAVLYQADYIVPSTAALKLEDIQRAYTTWLERKEA